MKPTPAMTRIGVRELRDRASAVLRRVRAGETLTITDRDRPIALLLPLGPASTAATLEQLLSTGRLAWSGGKPRGLLRPPRVRGGSVAEAVIEDRR